ncbi:tetratricopeptide repeat protein, partial [Escherichia coli]
KRAYCLKIQPATGSFARNLIYSTKPKLGWIYLKGLGVKPDTRKAILWYKEAAEQGYAHAQYTLGLIYRNGSGINVNHYESQKWLKLAAKQHYKNAERLLAGLPAH